MRHLLTGPGIRLMSGIAGSGKTTTMLTCAEVWREEGREVLGCALAGKAATKLQKETGIRVGDAGKSPLASSRTGSSRFDSKTVVLDEAGMVGTKDMAKLIRHVREAKDARLDSSRAMRSSSSRSTPGARSSSSSDILGEKRLTDHSPPEPSLAAGRRGRH